MKKVFWLVIRRLPAFILATAAASLPAAGLPDLVIYAPAVNPHVVFRTFASNDCTVGEGCVQPGTRRLLSFTTQSRNIGAADMVLGNPATNSAFVFDPCHNHYHYYGFAEYRLRDSSSNLVTLGKKIGFCLEDVLQFDPNARTNRLYDCNYQGIQKGWADVYPEDVPCQWIDVTGLASGNYILELETNPEHSIPESNYSNNIVQIPVFIPVDCSSPVVNDNFSSAQVIPYSPISFTAFNACATKEPGEPNHAGNAGGHSVWWVGFAPYASTVRLSTEGSDFDTLLAVYTGTNVTHLSLVASNDNSTTNIRQSSLSFNTTAGKTYCIAVDGRDGAFGEIKFSINPPLNNAFTNCQQITGLSGQTNGYNIGATKEDDEPDHNGNYGGSSIWYCWTAPATGLISFDTVGSDFDTILAVYTGNTLGSLAPVTSDNDSGGNRTSRAIFNATNGQLYRIAIDGEFGATGNLVLRWSVPGLLSISKSSGTNISLILAGGQGSYAIQGSSNLLNWLTLTNVSLSGSTLQYTDKSIPNIPRRFYRAVRSP